MLKRLGLSGLIVSALMFVGCSGGSDNETNVYSLLVDKTFFIAACDNDDYLQLDFGSELLTMYSHGHDTSNQETIDTEVTAIVYEDLTFIIPEKDTCHIYDYDAKSITLKCSGDDNSTSEDDNLTESKLWKTLQDAEENCSSEY